MDANEFYLGWGYTLLMLCSVFSVAAYFYLLFLFRESKIISMIFFLMFTLFWVVGGIFLLIKIVQAHQFFLNLTFVYASGYVVGPVLVAWLFPSWMIALVFKYRFPHLWESIGER